MFTGQRVAVKVIDKTKLYNRSDAKEAKEQLIQEVQCMKLVKHTNVVTLYQVSYCCPRYTYPLGSRMYPSVTKCTPR